MSGNPVGWFEIYVQDMARAKAFYETVFDAKLSKLEGIDAEMWAFTGDRQRYGAPGALVKMSGVASGGSSVMVYSVAPTARCRRAALPRREAES